jgi:hypothetical protein
MEFCVAGVCIVPQNSREFCLCNLNTVYGNVRLFNKNAITVYAIGCYHVTFFVGLICACYFWPIYLQLIV